LNAIVTMKATSPSTAPASTYPVPGWDSLKSAAMPMARASSAEPVNSTRNGALAWASAFIPRIAAIASAGSARSSPFITNVEKA